MHLSIKQNNITDTENRFVAAQEEKDRERMDWEFGVSRCKLGEDNGTPLQYSCLENSMDRGAWWAAIYGVEQSQTRLKQLSSSSRCKLLHIEWLNNKVLLYSTENYTGISHNGK